MPSRQRSWLARVAAPLAFLVLATLGVVAVRTALDEDSATTTVTVTTTAETTTTKKPASTTSQGNNTKNAKYYRVQSGDTLESIASDHGTTVEALLELNPGIDPVALTIGQRIRVG